MILVWHYRDLRLEDNPALSYATQTNQPVCPIYIENPKEKSAWKAGSASKWWLYHSLLDLQKRYKKAGGSLILKSGNPEIIFKHLISNNRVQEVCWNERFEPHIRTRDLKIKKWLQKLDIKVTISQGNYLTHPDQVRTTTGKSYVVFTPFARTLLKENTWDAPLEAPTLKKFPPPPSDTIDTLNLLPKNSWHEKFHNYWTPGRTSAEKSLQNFQKNHLKNYQSQRDFVAENSTSKLSPHITFGEISCREVWRSYSSHSHADPFLRQLLWREFANQFLYHFPKSPQKSWKVEFEKYQWQKSSKLLSAWKRGETGYPIIDAGMRQLWETGWMHNRARMIVGSFLTKDLHIHWLEGAKWFWNTLLDADLANNTLGWQWVSGSGPDASPFFRIFNPILQGKKFDPDGKYIRKYVPELSHLPNRWIHTPWEDPSSSISYPKPIVDHKQARKTALQKYQQMRSS